MGRSLFRYLHRQFGQRRTGADLVRRIDAHQARLASQVRFDLIVPVQSALHARPVRVAVVGGGFAGMAAASTLQALQAQVTLYEAKDRLGGRVQSTSTFIPHRILECGAELIGLNHPLWMRLARELGLGLSVLTDEDQLAGACLAPRVRLGGRTLTPDQVRDLYERMARALGALSQTARSVFTTPTSIKQPWTVANARTLDALSIDDWIQSVDRDPRSDLRAALRLEFSNDNAVAANQQSLLAVLALIAGGGFEGYWEDTEVYRCEDGNQALATRLAAQLTSVSPTASIQYEIVREVNIVDTHIDIVSTPQASGARQRVAHHDYAIVTAPPTVWPAISTGGWRFPAPVQMGPAVKYLAEVQSRYWIQPGMAPNGIDDQLGQLWEGTDNQMGSSGIDLTVFAGGPLASAVGRTPPRTYFAPKLEALLPGFQHSSTGRFAFADWPREPFIQTGYACPAPGQVTGVLPALLQPLGGRVFLAGEHTSPGFFGYMEGALQSGVDAALRVAAAAGIPIPPAPSSPLCPQRALSRVV